MDRTATIEGRGACPPRKSITSKEPLDAKVYRAGEGPQSRLFVLIALTMRMRIADIFALLGPASVSEFDYRGALEVEGREHVLSTPELATTIQRNPIILGENRDFRRS